MGKRKICTGLCGEGYLPKPIRASLRPEAALKLLLDRGKTVLGSRKRVLVKEHLL